LEGLSVKTLVIYDTMYGNTEKVAKAIGESITGDVKVLRAGEVKTSALNDIDLLIIGSPTQGGAATKPVQSFLDEIAGILKKDAKAAVFDTRMSTKLVGVFGYAAGKIADTLKSKGIGLVLPPEAFIINGSKGPLKEGELERAANWGKKIWESVNS
jgi:flavodoxin I